MGRKINKPVIDIQRIPAGERELESVMADVFLWMFRKYPKSSEKGAGTFVNGGFTDYNSDDFKNREANNDGTAA